VEEKMRVITGICKPFSGEVLAPPDKSVTHRALLLAAEADGSSLIRNPSRSADCLATVACLRALGVSIRVDHGNLRVGEFGLPLEVRRCELRVHPVDRIPPFETRVPGDPSGAAFLAGAAVSYPFFEDFGRLTAGSFPH